jgi:hypothetical protein
VTGWKRMLWTAGLVFVTAAGAQWLALGNDVFNTDLASWQVVVNAGVAALVALVINWAAPWIKQYGIGSNDTE